MANLCKAKNEIFERNRIFERNFKESDPVGLVNDFFASDDYQPVAFPPGNSLPVTGHEKLIELFSIILSEAVEIQLVTYQIIEDKSIVVEIGRAIITDKVDCKSIGRYIVCWRLTENGWRAQSDFFANDGWNMDIPC